MYLLFMTYHPETHQTPILWFNSKFSPVLKLGENEKIVKNISKSKFIKDCIYVKFLRADDNGKPSHIEITFTSGKKSTYNNIEYVNRDTIFLYKNCIYNNGNYIYNNKFTITFGQGTTMGEVQDARIKIDYIEYILSKVRESGLE